MPLAEVQILAFEVDDLKSKITQKEGELYSMVIGAAYDLHREIAELRAVLFAKERELTQPRVLEK